MPGLFSHTDSLENLNKKLPLSDKLDLIRNNLLNHYNFIDRIAVTVYDSETDMLKTLSHSSHEHNPLLHFQARLSEALSLHEIIEKGRPRVVHDMSIFPGDRHEYTRKLADQGYRSSYTYPIFFEERFYGFIFFNSFQKHVFHERVLDELDLCSHMIMLLVVNELTRIGTLTATVRSALSMTHVRDPETGGHIARMARFSRLIASELAEAYGFSDLFIEHIFLFSPLHDLGKIGIPDQILLKPGKLTSEEFEIMKTHANRGREMIDDLLNNYNLDRFQYIDMLRNIAEHHHEAFDGSGYPGGLHAGEIPIEARIVAVADVFDALTSTRPYKPAWSNARAFEKLRQLAGTKLDKDCVAALLKNASEVEQIQSDFNDQDYR